MYELSEIPSRAIRGDLGEHGEGVIGVLSGHERIELFPDAREVLQALYLGNYGDDIRIAAASSANTPLAVKIGRTVMSILEILPGVTMREVFAKGWPENFEGNLQIGRSPPLSPNKATTHFPILRQETGIEYDKMIFFDDCNWGDHCTAVQRQCPGVVAQCTPHGLTIAHWNTAMKEFDQRYS
jgi:magnesium-dependent phosphatase 1